MLSATGRKGDFDQRSIDDPIVFNANGAFLSQNLNLDSFAIDALNEDFEDIITGDKIRSIEAMPEEQDEVATLNLQRIAFGFNRKDYGRLRHLINVLNTL